MDQTKFYLVQLAAQVKERWVRRNLSRFSLMLKVKYTSYRGQTGHVWGQMLGHGGSRALPDIARGEWMDPFVVKVAPSGLPDPLDDTANGEVESYDSAGSSDSENDLVFFPADKVSGKVNLKADREVVRSQAGQLGYLEGNLTDSRSLVYLRNIT